MSHAAVADGAAPAAAALAPPSVLRPATYDDLKIVYPRLMEVIETSPFYNDEFKAHEKGRLTPPISRRWSIPTPGMSR